MTEQLNFTFEELDSKAKDTVVAWWTSDLTSELDTLLESNIDYVREFLKSPELDLNCQLHGQGCGVNIAGKLWFDDVFEWDGFNDGHFTDKEVARMKHYIENGCSYVSAPYNYDYGYCKISSANIFNDFMYYLPSNYHNIDNSLLYKFEERVWDFIGELCSKLHDVMLDNYEEMFTHSYVAEVCKANEYVFTKDGECAW